MQQQWAWKRLFATLVIQSLLTRSTAYSRGEFKCSSGMYESLCLRDDYKPFDLPNPDSPNEILVSINVDEVLKIDDDDNSILFSAYFNVEWNETRLYVAPDFASQQDGFKPISEEVLTDLWMPNIFIYSLKSFSVMNVYSSLSGLWMDSNKAILYSKASHISFFCPMNFALFPLDTHHCKFLVGSYSYNNNNMVFTTKEAGYNYKEANSLALGFDISKCILSL